jgi:hypothetical protein
MSDPIGSLIRRAVVAVCLVGAAQVPAVAQQPLSPAPSSAQFLSRFDFTMSAAALTHNDNRFSWDTHWAGDLDLVDYVQGRFTFLADYQALLGSEFRPFDPYQSNYLLELSSSYRLGGTEIAGVFSHISRHLGDRFKRVAVAENSVGPRVMRRFAGSKGAVDLRVDARKVIARAYADYSWIGDVAVGLHGPTGRRVMPYAQMIGTGIGVDPVIAGRKTQYGGRAEGGVRIAGTAGDLEFFGGVERMIDADPLDRLPRRWAFVGFRLLRH